MNAIKVMQARLNRLMMLDLAAGDDFPTPVTLKSEIRNLEDALRRYRRFLDEAGAELDKVTMGQVA